MSFLQADTLEKYFQGSNFKKACDAVFQSVDADKSNSIDKEEATNALRMVIEKLPGVRYQPEDMQINKLSQELLLKHLHGHV